MLEIFALIFLCIKNLTNAKARGRSGGAAVGYTLGLWIGGEFLGGFIGTLAGLGIVAYLLAILFAIGGGVTSYFIAKSGDVIAQGQPFPCAVPGMPVNDYNPQFPPQNQPMYPYQPNAVNCQACGAPILPNGRFCMNCGKPVDASQALSNNPPIPPQPQPIQQAVPAPVNTPPVPVPTVCPKCGSALEGDSVFCAECGTKVS